MANLKASKQYIKKNKRNRERNKHYKSTMRTAIKNAIISIESNAENKFDQVKLACKVIDKTYSKGVVHKNFAARKKSKLMLLHNSSIKSTK